MCIHLHISVQLHENKDTPTHGEDIGLHKHKHTQAHKDLFLVGTFKLRVLEIYVQIHTKIGA